MVSTLYADILGEAEHEFIKSFSHLTHNAQCLFIRLHNRKRPLFRFDDLKYPEITIVDAIDELKADGFLRGFEEEDYIQLCKRHRELVQLFLDLCQKTVRKRAQTIFRAYLAISPNTGKNKVSPARNR